MGIFYTKEQNLEHIITTIEGGQIDKRLHDLMVNYSTSSNNDIKYYSENLLNKLKELNFYYYFDEKLIHYHRNWKVLVLFLAILKKNYNFIICLRTTHFHDLFIIVFNTSLPTVHEIIDDKMFSLLTLGNFHKGISMSRIIFWLHCKQIKTPVEERMINVINKHSLIGDNDSKRMDKEMIKRLHSFDKTIAKDVIIMKISYNQISDEEIADLYEFIENDEYCFELFLEYIINENSIDILKELIQKGFKLRVNKELDVNFKNVSLELIELLSSLENFDDFVQINRHNLMKTVNNEVRDYLLKKI